MRKTVLLTCIIAAVCALLLFLSVILQPESKQESQPAEEQSVPQEPAPEQPVQTSEEEQKQEQPQEQKPAEQKPAEQKPAEQKPPAVTGKTESKEPAVRKNEEKEPAGEKRPEKKLPAVPPKTVVPEKKTVIVPHPPVFEEKPLMEIPDAENHAVLAFVFDDGGQNAEQVKKILKLPFRVTVAVLPGLSHSVECARLVRSSGCEVILHQPMQAINTRISPGPDAITPDMRTFDIEQTIKKNIAQIGPVAGLNNHEGSLIMENEIQAGAVLDAASAMHVYFLDSRTTAETRAPQAALERGICIYSRDIFLDNEKTKENVLQELKKGLAAANRKGYSIMIGHVWSADLIPPLLSELYPQLIKKGYRFAVVSALPRQ